MPVLPVNSVKQRRFGQLFFLLIVLVTGCGRNERMDTVYLQRCISCHGNSGRGDGPLAVSLPVRPPDFRDTVQRKSNSLQMVRFLSREGRDLAWWERFDTLVVAHCNIPWDTVLGYDEPAEEKKP